MTKELALLRQNGRVPAKRVAASQGVTSIIYKHTHKCFIIDSLVIIFQLYKKVETWKLTFCCMMYTNCVREAS